MTHAEEIAAQFDDDGQTWFDDDGVYIQDVCQIMGATEDDDSGVIRYLFTDGSAIVIAEGCWDIEGDEPFSWEGAR